MQIANPLETILVELPTIKDYHSSSHLCYNMLKKIARNAVVSLFSKEDETPKRFAPFGEICLPYFKMGAIDSLDLFGLDELILFSFYWKNKDRYKRVLDIGGNIGLHSILLSKSGYEVQVFEPDATHFNVLSNNLKLNGCANVSLHKAAVSCRNGTAEFTRVLGNTTSSHLSGSKKPYGELETYSVEVLDIKELITRCDLIKMDVEGHEKDILLDLCIDHFKKTDVIVEIGSFENAQHIFEHLKKIKVNAFSQKIGWRKVQTIEDMPMNHREGSLFITLKEEMPWS